MAGQHGCDVGLGCADFVVELVDGLEAVHCLAGLAGLLRAVFARVAERVRVEEVAQLLSEALGLGEVVGRR